MGSKGGNQKMMHSSEYHNMALAEREHWWYKSLHKLVLGRIKVLKETDISILDAGCGTGGMMMELINHDYSNVEGYDASDLAIDYCLKNNLKVIRSTHQELISFVSRKQFDVIICLDSLYFLSSKEQGDFLKACYEILKNEGILFINLPALKAFSGKHDKVVGINERISQREFISRIPIGLFNIGHIRYWPFVLSPVIYLKRKWDKIFGTEGTDLNKSSNIINAILEFLVSLEFKYGGKYLVGSSLFIELRKNNQDEYERS